MGTTVAEMGMDYVLTSQRRNHRCERLGIQELRLNAGPLRSVLQGASRCSVRYSSLTTSPALEIITEKMATTYPAYPHYGGLCGFVAFWTDNSHLDFVQGHKSYSCISIPMRPDHYACFAYCFNFKLQFDCVKE